MALKLSLVSFVALLAAAGCNFSNNRAPAPSADAAPGGADAYPRLAAELFEPTCAGCHNHGRAAGGVNVTTYELLTAPGLVVAGDSQGSLLFRVIESGDMPRGGGTVAPDLLAALACWIDQGAPKTGAGDCFPAAPGNEGGGADAGSADGNADGAETPPPPSGEGAYARLAAELFNTTCAGCHNHGRAAAGVNVTTYELVTAPGLVKAGNSAGSILYQVIKSGEMPMGGDPVAPRLVQALACWIDLGAPKSGGDECFDTSSTLPPPPPPPPPAGGDDDDGRGDDDGGAGPLPPDTTDAFNVLAAELFGASCAGCHNDGRAAGGVNVSSYEHLTSGTLIVPGQSRQSAIYQVIASGDMPLGNGTVAPRLLAALACWIDRGAPKVGEADCLTAPSTPPPPPPPPSDDDDDDRGGQGDDD